LAQGNELPIRTVGATLFADIAGFTPLTNMLTRALGPRRGAEVLTRHLNLVYGALIAEIDRYGGSVVDFSGDAINCWFSDRSHYGDGSRRAVTAALALQTAAIGISELVVPDGPTVQVALKVAIAAGMARRFIVGDPAVRRIDVMAGGPVPKAADAEHAAARGEIVLDLSAVDVLGTDVEVTSWRAGAAGQIAVLGGLAGPAGEAPWPATEIPADVTEWVDHRLRDRDEDTSTELRPAVALFVRFGGIDLESDYQAGERLDVYVRWAQGILEPYDGHLLQVTVGDKGSYLYAAFGAPTSHEDIVDRALAAALELRAIPPPPTGMTVPPAIGVDQGIARVGSYGGPTRRTYGVLGDAVNRAARLMTSASPGEILVSAEVRSSSRRRLTFEDVEPVPVKGHAEPLAVARFVGRPIGTGTTKFGVFVGRGAEIARVSELVEAVVSGPGRTVLIEGDPGAGKSHLVHEVRRRLLARHDLTWLAVDTDEAKPGTLAPFLPVLRDLFYLDLASDEEAERVLFDVEVDQRIKELQEMGTSEADLSANMVEDLRSYLAAVLGIRWRDSAFEEHEPSTRSDQCLRAIVAYLHSASLLRPLVVHVHDAQDLDAESLRLVELLATSAEQSRLCLVMDRRPDSTPLPVTFDRIVNLEPMDRAGVAALIEEILDGPTASGVDEHIHHRTTGNALFVEQLVVDLKQRRKLVCGADGRWTLSNTAESDLPVTVNSVLLSRLDRLDPRVQRTAQAASVLGEVFERDVLLAMRAGPANQIDSILHAGATDGVWSSVDGKRYEFRHALFRDAAYGMQLDHRLRSQHRLAARAIVRCRGRNGSAGEIARHWRSADLPLWAAAAFRRAAGEAAQRLKLRDAVGHYEAALEQSELAGCTASVRARLHLGAAEAAAALGDHALALAHFDALLGPEGGLTPAEVVTWRTQRGEALHRIGRTHEARLEYEAGLLALQDAPDLLDASRIYAGLALVHGQLGELDEAVELAETALTLARDDDAAEARAHQRIAQVQWCRLEYEKSLTHGLASLERYVRLNDRRGRGAAHNTLGLVYAALGRSDDAIFEFEVAVDDFERTGSEHGLACALDNLAQQYARKGANDQAMVPLERAVEILTRIGMGPDGLVAAMWQGGFW
jgi:class 3 adenylate cyclase/tetratricopeptide (TPR) repeat protein